MVWFWDRVENDGRSIAVDVRSFFSFQRQFFMLSQVLHR